MGDYYECEITRDVQVSFISSTYKKWLNDDVIRSFLAIIPKISLTMFHQNWKTKSSPTFNTKTVPNHDAICG